MKDNFIDGMLQKTGLSSKRIKEILAENGYTTFNPELMKDYEAAILSGMALIESVKDKMFTPQKPQELPCPIPGCEGHKKFNDFRDSLFSWGCTVGGTWHCVVEKVVELRLIKEGIEKEEELDKFNEYASRMIERKQNGSNKTVS